MPGVVKVKALWDTLRTSYWFVPTVLAAAAVVLWMVVHRVDIWLQEGYATSPAWLYTGGPEGAREVLGVVAGSMITVSGVTFSITIVALTLASQQFGPFLLRNFMRDLGNQVVLGTFIATFIFCLLTLRVIRGTDRITYVPHLTVSVAVGLAIASLGILIFFIHHVSAFIQVSNIISLVSRELHEVLDRLFPERLGRGGRAPEDPRLKAPENFDAGAAEVVSPRYGYIKALDNEMLLTAASQHGLIVKLLKRPGDFVGEGDAIASVWPAASVTPEVDQAVLDSFLLGGQRTATQDAGFVFDQMVEIAVRALSPGINDPFTAIICIDHLGQGLRSLGGRAFPSPYRLAGDGSLRVIAHPVTFAEMAELAFGQIRHYGGSSPAVAGHLLETIAAVGCQVRDVGHRAVLLQQALLAYEASSGVKEKAAQQEIERKYREVVSAITAGAQERGSG